jgi:hypothetical protein
MELIIKDINIFDKEFEKKIYELIKDNLSLFDKQKYYSVTVNYSMQLTHDTELWCFENSVFNDIDSEMSKSDRIYEALSNQLHKFDEVLSNNSIYANYLDINGKDIERGTIQIQITETDIDATVYHGRGKNKKPYKAFCVNPDVSYVNNVMDAVIQKTYAEQFYGYLELVKDQNIVAEILGVSETCDISDLAVEFAKQFGTNLFTKPEEKQNKAKLLQEKTLEVIRKRRNEVLQID